MPLRFDRESYANQTAQRLLQAPAELLLEAWPPLKPPLRVLELAAGAGLLTRPLLDRMAPLEVQLVAIEAHWGLATHLPHAQGRAARTLAEGRRLPLCAQAFDVVIANLVLGDRHEDLARLAELRRVLRPGGWLLSTSLLRGSFDALLDVLTETCEAEGLHECRQALSEVRPSLPDEANLALALGAADISVVHMGIEERGLFFDDGATCLADPLVRDLLLPSWLADAPPLPQRALAHAAHAIDTYFVGRRLGGRLAGPFALPVRTAIVTGRAGEV